MSPPKNGVRVSATAPGWCAYTFILCVYLHPVRIPSTVKSRDGGTQAHTSLLWMPSCAYTFILCVDLHPVRIPSSCAYIATPQRPPNAQPPPAHRVPLLLAGLQSSNRGWLGHLRAERRRVYRRAQVWPMLFFCNAYAFLMIPAVPRPSRLPHFDSIDAVDRAAIGCWVLYNGFLLCTPGTPSLKLSAAGCAVMDSTIRNGSPEPAVAHKAAVENPVPVRPTRLYALHGSPRVALSAGGHDLSMAVANVCNWTTCERTVKPRLFI